VPRCGHPATTESAKVEEPSAPANAIEDDTVVVDGNDFSVVDENGVEFRLSGDCSNVPPTVTLTNDSSSTVWVSVEGGPQNESVASNSSKQLQPTSSFRITRDGGSIMLQMRIKRSENCDPPLPSDIISFRGEDGEGNECFRVDVGKKGDSATVDRAPQCSGRNLSLVYTGQSDMSGGSDGQVVLTGTNWN